MRSGPEGTELRVGRGRWRAGVGGGGGLSEGSRLEK